MIVEEFEYNEELSQVTPLGCSIYAITAPPELGEGSILTLDMKPASNGQDDRRVEVYLDPPAMLTLAKNLLVWAGAK